MNGKEVEKFSNFRLYLKSSENMEEIPDQTVHLIVTSPPYNVGKEYEPEVLSLSAYRAFLKRVWKECYRVLVEGGRICVNIANIGRNPYIPLHVYLIEDLLEIGFLMRGEIIWDKGASVGSSTAWGSWCSPSNPSLRDVHEYILVFSKKKFKRDGKNLKSTITRDEFLEYTKSIWRFPTASAKKIGHPAPFPVELPRRCIKLYSYEGDVILDPFAGSGQTGIAAIEGHRKFIGYEINPKYYQLAKRRLEEKVKNPTFFPI
jgi:site-specific DNA-methyltransferase (adenine-specific)